MKFTSPSRFCRAVLWFVPAVALLSGCATRPPRDPGPPSTPVMPPSTVNEETDLPPPVEVDFGPVVTTPAPPPPPAGTSVARPAPAPRPGTPYKIKKGESLSAIAARNRMSWKKLAEYNHIANPDKVRVGQTILIPPSAGGASGSVSTSRRPAPPPPPANSGSTYVVQSGDTLSGVARKYNTTVSELKDVNGMRNDRLLVGQILKLPAGSASRPASPPPAPSVDTASAPAPRSTPVPTRPVSTPAAEIPVMGDNMGDNMGEPEMTESDPEPEDEDPMVDKPFTIVVMEGDTLESIAANYVVSVEDIRKINDLPANAELEPGQKLKMPPGLY